MTAADRFDPRAKLTLVVAFVVAGFLATDVVDLLVLLGMLMLVVAGLGSVTLREWLTAIAPLGYLVVILLVLNTLFYASGPAWVSIPLGPIDLAVTTGGVQTAVLIAVRLVLVAGVAAWFALGTDTRRFEAALVGLGVPWSLAFLLSLTVRLVPVMRERFRRIEDAQRSRGLDLSGGPISRTRARVPMLVPFFAAVIRYGYDLSAALTARGFDEPGPRTAIVTVTHGPADVVLYVLALGVLATGVCL